MPAPQKEKKEMRPMEQWGLNGPIFFCYGGKAYLIGHRHISDAIALCIASAAVCMLSTIAMYNLRACVCARVFVVEAAKELPQTFHVLLRIGPSVGIKHLLTNRAKLNFHSVNQSPE